MHIGVIRVTQKEIFSGRIYDIHVVSFFVSEETTELFRYGTCGAILAESLIAVIHRVYELLSGKSTKIWHKVLLVICIVLILLLVLIK